MEQGTKGTIHKDESIKVELKNDRLIIDIPADVAHMSRRGQSMIVASTHGLLDTGILFKGELPILLQVNAMVDLNMDTLLSTLGKRK